MYVAMVRYKNYGSSDPFGTLELFGTFATAEGADAYCDILLDELKDSLERIETIGFIYVTEVHDPMEVDS